MPKLTHREEGIILTVHQAAMELEVAIQQAVAEGFSVNLEVVAAHDGYSVTPAVSTEYDPNDLDPGYRAEG